MIFLQFLASQGVIAVAVPLGALVFLTGLSVVSLVRIAAGEGHPPAPRRMANQDRLAERLAQVGAPDGPGARPLGLRRHTGMTSAAETIAASRGETPGRATAASLAAAAPKPRRVTLRSNQAARPLPRPSGAFVGGAKGKPATDPFRTPPRGTRAIG